MVKRKDFTMILKGMSMVKRTIFDNIIEWLGRDKVIIIKGARQVGKTTLLLALKEYVESAQKRAIYISADETMSSDFLNDARLFLKYLNFEYGIRNDVTIFIDEFQYIHQAGLFIKVLNDIIKREHLNIQLIVSGSSSLEISKNTEFLTGRKIEYSLFPFSFREYLSTDRKFQKRLNLDRDFQDLIDYYEIYRRELEQKFSFYILWGGYPEVALEESAEPKRRIMQDIISTYIEKDISNFLKIENISAFNNLAKILSYQIGSLVNRNELSGTLGINYKTVSKYLDILEGTFIYSFITPYFTNIRKELSRMPKVYLDDTGIYYYYNPQQFLQFNSIPGNVIENYVYITLRRMKSIDSVQFYRTISKSEIDFVIKKWEKIIPIEVKFRKTPKVPAVLKRFMEKQNSDKGIIITKDSLRIEDNVYFIPVTLLGFIDF